MVFGVQGSTLVWWVLLWKMMVLPERLQTPLQDSDDSIVCWWPKAPKCSSRWLEQPFDHWAVTAMAAMICTLYKTSKRVWKNSPETHHPRLAREGKLMAALMRGGIFRTSIVPQGRYFEIWIYRGCESPFVNACLKHVNIAITTMTI